MSAPTPSDIAEQRKRLDSAQRMLRVGLALEELEQGEHANTSRDFGRGVAWACHVIRAALEGTTP